MEFKEIWDKFSQIKKEDLPLAKKGNMNLDYLSWAHALHLAIDSFSNLTFHCDKERAYDDGSMMVFASITIEEHTREMWLPVMDNKNNSIINASSRQVSDNKMRCLVKCLALFGLGLNVYAGEDLKYLDEETPQKKEPVKEKAPSKEAEKTAEDSVHKSYFEEDVPLLCNVLLSEESVNGVISTWSDNFEEGVKIAQLKQEGSEHYDNLVEHRNVKLHALLEKIKDGGGLSKAVNSASKHLMDIKAVDEKEFEGLRSLFTQRKNEITDAQNGVD